MQVSTAVHNEMLAARTIRASSCNILQIIFLSASSRWILGELSANSRRALALDVDGFHRNQCIIMQHEFSRELGESVCTFGVDAPKVYGSKSRSSFKLPVSYEKTFISKRLLIIDLIYV